MKETIHRLVDTLFQNIPFSKKSEEAGLKIRAKLEEEYEEELKKTGNAVSAVEAVIRHSHDIREAGAAAGFTQEEIEGLTDAKGVVCLAELKKILKKYRLLILAEIFLLVWGINQTFILLSMLVSGSVWPGLLIFAAMVVVIDGLAAAVRKKKVFYEMEYPLKDRKLDSEGEEYLKAFYDRVCKKELNMMFLGFAVLACIVFSSLVSVFTSVYSIKDIFRQISFSSNLLELMLFLLLKNVRYRKLCRNFLADVREERYQCQIRKAVVLSAVYWVVVIGFLVGLTAFKLVVHFFNTFMAAMAVYAVLVLVYNLTFRREAVFRNIVVNRKKIVVVSLLAVSLILYQVMSMDLWLTQPYISQVASLKSEGDEIHYNSENGVYTIATGKDEFKILQLTDIHLGGSVFSVSKDLKALEAVHALLEDTCPDLVVVTGDLVFPMGIMSYSLNNRAPVMQFASFMRNTGIPWVFTYGNHDTEAMSVITGEQFDDLMKSLSFKSSQNLLYPYVQPDIYGRSNQMLEIRQKDGTLMQALFLLDSNDYTDGGSMNEYDYIHEDQVKWYERQVEALCEKEGGNVPSMLFFHIPLQEYKEAYELYETGSPEVTYFYGENGEKMMDKVCCSRHPSRLFDTALRLGSTKAMFCGHDHYNNLSVEYKGIRLTYGYSIDYLAMPGIHKDTAQRGGTLITIQKDGTFEVEGRRLTDIG